METAIIPKAPGLLAAYGLLTEDMRRDFVQTNVMELDHIDFLRRHRHVSPPGGRCLRWFEKEQIPAADRRLEYYLDMRYKGQNYEITVPFDETVTDMEALKKAVHRNLPELYSYSSADEIQIVNFGLSALGVIAKPKIAREDFVGEDASAAVIGSRTVLMAGRKPRGVHPLRQGPAPLRKQNPRPGHH